METRKEKEIIEKIKEKGEIDFNEVLEMSGNNLLLTKRVLTSLNCEKKEINRFLDNAELYI